MSHINVVSPNWCAHMWHTSKKWHQKLVQIWQPVPFVIQYLCCLTNFTRSTLTSKVHHKWVVAPYRSSEWLYKPLKMSKMSKKTENFDNILKKLKKVKKLRQHRYYLGKLKEKKEQIMTIKVLISVRGGQTNRKSMFSTKSCACSNHRHGISPKVFQRLLRYPYSLKNRKCWLERLGEAEI